MEIAGLAFPPFVCSAENFSFGVPGPVGCGLRCADDDSFLREASVKTSTPFLAPLPPHKPPSISYSSPLLFFLLPTPFHTTAIWGSFRPETITIPLFRCRLAFPSLSTITFSPPSRLRSFPYETHPWCATTVPPWTTWDLLHYNQQTSPPHPTNASAASLTKPPPILHLQQRCQKPIPTIFRSTTLPANSPNYSPSYLPTTLSPPSSPSYPITMGSFSAMNPWPAILALVSLDPY